MAEETIFLPGAKLSTCCFLQGLICTVKRFAFALPSYLRSVRWNYFSNVTAQSLHAFQMMYYSVKLLV